MAGQSPEMLALSGFFNKIQFRPYTLDELRTHEQNLRQSIVKSIARPPGQKMAPDEMMAIDTGSEPLTKAQWDMVPAGTQALGCNFGGQNWKVVLAEKNNRGKVGIIDTRELKNIHERDRKVAFPQLIGRMADQIGEVVKDKDISAIQAIAMSLGFAHKKEATEIGEDGAFTDREISKFWEITDFAENLFIGRALFKALEERGIQLPHRLIYIDNDTKAVANAVIDIDEAIEKLAMGGVFGTGMNLFLRRINLEIGHKKLSSDEVAREMARRGFLPFKEEGVEKRFEYEHMIGGDYIKYRALAALGLAGNRGLLNNEIAEGVIRRILDDKNESIVSDLARGDKETQIRLDMADDIYEAATLAAKTALAQAGQLMITMIHAVAAEAGFTGQKAYVPVEGSVYAKGEGIQSIMKKTSQELHPGNQLEIKEVNGLEGMIQYAMYHSTLKLNTLSEDTSY